MSIQVLYFAAVRDLVGKDEESVDFVGTIAELAKALEQRHPVLAGRLASVRFARNEEFATNDEICVDGDIVAVIPPVAGG